MRHWWGLRLVFVSTNRSLSRLSFRNNRIADVAGIAHALRQNTSLTFLDLRDNMISGSAMWSEVLVDRATPLELNLRNCPLRDDALVDLSLALSRQGLLSKVQFGWDLLTGDGVALFLRSLQTNVNLKDLELYPNTWDGGAFDAPVEVLPCCVCLRSLKTNHLWWKAEAESWGDEGSEDDVSEDVGDNDSDEYDDSDDDITEPDDNSFKYSGRWSRSCLRGLLPHLVKTASCQPKLLCCPLAGATQ